LFACSVFYKKTPHDIKNIFGFSRGFSRVISHAIKLYYLTMLSGSNSLKKGLFLPRPIYLTMLFFDDFVTISFYYILFSIVKKHHFIA